MLPTQTEAHLLRAEMCTWDLQLPGCGQVAACPFPTSAAPCHCQLHTACRQVAPEENVLRLSSKEEGGRGREKKKRKERRKKKSRGRERESECCYSEKLLCSCKGLVLEGSQSLISIWFLAHRFNQKKKRKQCKAFEP